MVGVNSTTVQHTGTRFLIRHLLTEQARLEKAEDAPAEGRWFHRHCTLKNLMEMTRICERGGYPLVISMRHPREVALSWKKKGYALADFRDSFRRLFTFERFSPLYVAVDSLSTRQRQLQALSDILGCELKTDWKPVGVDNENAMVPLDDDEEAMVAGLMREYSGIFSRWYAA